MNLKGILSKGKLEEIEFIFPPTDLQQQFGDYVENIQKQISHSRDTKKELEHKKAEMLSSYLG